MRHLAGLFFCLCLLSCGKQYGDHPPYPISGVVLVNGQPAKGARVVFHHLGDWGEKSIVPQAVTGEDGRFVLSTYGVGDGAPAGEYQVVVEWPAYRRGRNVGPDRMMGKFAKPKTSGLRVQIKKGNNELAPFDLKAELSEIDPNDPTPRRGGSRRRQ
jgi:hypothetical protein